MPTQDWDLKVKRVLERIDESPDINQRNEDLIREYKRDQVLNGMSKATLGRNLNRLKILAEQLGDKHFDEQEKDDLKDLVEWLFSQDYEEGTIDTYKKVIRSFYTWLHEGDIPDKADWITVSPSRKNDTLPKDLLTKEDITQQIDAAANPRDKALIAMLYETGARIGELIDLTVGDIEDRRRGKKIIIDGKTGARRLPLVESAPYLNRWLNQHPNPTKDAPLWCKIQQGGADDQLGYRYIRAKILKKTMEKAGIDKPSNPHHYRHSRASYLANELKEAQLCEWFGWVQGSDVPAKYVHLSGRDIDDAYDRLHGVEPEEEKDKDESVRVCPRCEELNTEDAKFCSRCGQALDESAALAVETVEEQAEELIPEVETETEARVVQAVLRELRENPEVALEG